MDIIAAVKSVAYRSLLVEEPVCRIGIADLSSEGMRAQQLVNAVALFTHGTILLFSGWEKSQQNNL